MDQNRARKIILIISISALCLILGFKTFCFTCQADAASYRSGYRV